MSLDTPTLLDALNSVTVIPVVPYKNYQIDFHGHAKNIDYLMTNNYLDNDRPRVISIAGTSPIHHMSADDQIKLYDETGKQMANEGVLMAAVVPNPIEDAVRHMERLASLDRAPDVYLVMPVAGLSNPRGIYDTFMWFGEQVQQFGARLLYYFRQPADLDCVISLLNDSDEFVGVKVGTGEEHVQPLINGVQGENGANAMVIWGKGDRCTEAARLGAKGHTSGISVICARAGDEINNAQRRGDYETSQRIENDVAAIEDIRFRNGREYNYAAVIEAMNRSGFDDIVGGEGAPFNANVTPDVAKEVEQALETLRQYH